MNEHYSFTKEENERLSEEQKQKLLAIFSGERLADVYRDVIAKHVFSPDQHPERMDFILQHTMNQPGLSVINSATNEPGSKSYYSKKTISDISAWLVDHRLADLEFQASPQEFIFTRTDIYGSEMLLLQYSSDPGQP
ncbi:MAG: hypothetical protein K6F87_05990, partial [Lachnospiraceae bacterium]|nr:hypothetical protein [Lachnospiraceae bacterium]